MATVVTVHGTFAHSAGTADALNIGEQGEAQWWQQGSTFEADLKNMVEGADGQPLEVIPFTWSSLNSEVDRRSAGSALLKALRTLDARGEPYCVVGHSHGGSVISSALIESVAQRRPLTHLKRWVTVGTPFVGMRKERFLFSRLTLTRKVLFVASLMLLMMFLFYVAGELFGNGFRSRSERYYTGLLFSGLMMSLPMAFFYLVFRYFDGKELKGYSKGAVQRAQQYYGDKWLPLCHKDDEAVQGLRFLPKVQLHFFEKNFAASTLTKASVLALPLAYLFVVTSPSVMLGISNFLQTKVYDVQEFVEEDSAATKAREELFSLGQRMRQMREQSETNTLNPTAAEDARRGAEDLRQQLREKRRQIEQMLPEFADVERAQRFKRRFLQKDGKPCEGGQLCGGGHDYALNSKLLFHVVTDELSSAVVDDTYLGGRAGGIVRLLLPIVFVPLVFALLALGVLAVIEYLAAFISKYLSIALNYLTLAEVKRSTFGNDTEGEVVVGADYGPSWLEPVTCLLPDEVSNRISAHSNAMAAESIAKFRNAISTLAFAEGEDTKQGLISNYLSWKELVHTSYFDVPAFRKIVVRAISQAEDFQPTHAFTLDRDYDQVAVWLADLGRKIEAEQLGGVMISSPEPAQTPVSFPA
ncbi:hypothetical protein [Hyphomicrobium sp.]|uniref:hypothetical protein n=1 Tax=Hyphomicrobium sp. TaxID=82 RepID=UPI002E363F56|nr:hypothetical protein [Hyphomicrobium sp.]HEX2842825.1 hypothetical protein [Hyphomicrobium sp.]